MNCPPSGLWALSSSVGSPTGHHKQLGLQCHSILSGMLWQHKQFRSKPQVDFLSGRIAQSPGTGFHPDCPFREHANQHCWGLGVSSPILNWQQMLDGVSRLSETCGLFPNVHVTILRKPIWARWLHRPRWSAGNSPAPLTGRRLWMGAVSPPGLPSQEPRKISDVAKPSRTPKPHLLRPLP